MKKIIYYITAMVLLTGILISCNDEFLETKPLGTESEESFYTTMVAADQATTVCYSLFSMEKLWDFAILMSLGSVPSDEAQAGGRDYVDHWNGASHSIDMMQHHSSLSTIWEYVYGYLYRTVGYCNVALERLPSDPIKEDPAYDAVLIDKHMGEVYFLRAFNYFTLTQIFGGVPKVDRVLNPSEFNMPRSSISEIYALIKSDLRLAISKLPTKAEWGNENIGRANKGAAQGLLAKVYLYESSYAKNYAGDERFAGLEEHWDSVNYFAEQVIASGQYGLVGLNGERFDSWRDPANGVGGYYHIFSPGANNSEEEVFSIQCRQDNLGWLNSRGTLFPRWCAPRFTNTPGAGATGYEGPGWGWWSPTQYLVDAFEPGDIRYEVTVLEETDTFPMFLDEQIIWVTPNYENMKASMNLHRNMRKYECHPDEYWSITSEWKEGPTNLKMIRYADLLLMNSEAYLERGMQTEALENINLVRQRARLSGDAGVPADLSGTLTLDQIKHERLVELGCEGHRFFDLIRWGNAEEYLDHELADGLEVNFVPGKHEFFPLPESQVLMSNGVLEQNPGY